ncbi:MAG: uroporphyrinogen decarboxylase family protein [Nitrososphaeria archaeon]
MTHWDEAEAIARGKMEGVVPVVLHVYGMVLKRFGQVKEYDYYQNVKLQLESKIMFQRRFPDVINIMNGFPEYMEGNGPIPTALGAEIGWMDDYPPYVLNYPVKVPEDVDRLTASGLPDVRTGVASEILKRVEYFYEWFPKDLREEYGYVDGVICTGGIVEGVALTMGYDKFFVWMRKYPDVLHKLLKFATDWQLKYCKAIEDIVGPCKLLFVPDHVPHMVGKEQFREFVLPYLNKILNNYNNALRIWHNEGNTSHIIEEIDKINAEVWHFGPAENIPKCMEKTHFCLMGNIHPPDLVKMSPQDVIKACENILSKTGAKRFWLSTGGGMSPNTPFKNIDAMVFIAKKFSKKD